MKSLRWSVLLALVLVVVTSAARAPAPPVLAEDGARIDSPAPGEQVSGKVEIRGVATTSDPSAFSFYRLHYGSGSSPAVFRPIGPPGTQPVDGGTLGTWDTTSLLLGDYTLMLTVYDTSGQTTTASVVVTVIPGPTPTPLTNLPPAVYPTPSAEATPSEDQGEQPAPTPIPELPQLVPEIPNIDVPPPAAPNPPAIPGPDQTAPPNLAPIPDNPVVPQQPPPGPSLPNPAPPSAPSSVDTGTNISPPPPPPPINPVAPPPAPIIQPYEPPPPPPTIAPPTPFGLPP